MQTILGAGGDIGRFLAVELTNYTNKIRLVARTPQRVNDSDELFPADLTNKDAVFKAVEGSEVVYLTVGFKYDINVWQKNWPVVMKNVIDACLHYGAKLVFFDNVYMYAKTAIPHMTEESLIDPPSKKGIVRAKIFEMLMKAIQEDGLPALVARSADFYGPDAKNGLLNIGVINNFQKKKSAFWQSDVHKIHSVTFTPDAAKATALLGNTQDAYGQVWHLPTSKEKLTGKQYIELIAGIMKMKPRYFILNKFLMRLMGLFSPVVKELQEMQYQNDQDYFFDSSKFEKRFGIVATAYEEGLKLAVNQY
ncbi:MAG: NAD-dependent epimerase/dehydratase family protein [Niabella sp.]